MWEGGANRSGKKRAWHNLYVGHTHLYIRPGRVLRGRGGLEGKKTCACINVMGAVFRASFSFNNTKVSPEGVAKSAYMLKHATPPRLFANILQVAPKIFVGFFCVFDKRQRERALSDRKKNSVKHQQFKDLVICFFS